jgi:hypothetical protein
VECYFTVHVRPAGFSPATWAQLGPAQKKTIIIKNKNSSKIISKNL